MDYKQFWFGSVIGSCLTVAVRVNSQIIPDGTTIDTSVLGNCQSSCEITGGTAAGQNLFHSFGEFNISAGEQVYFADPGVTNILSRITGVNPSEIFGTLGVSGGDANLFLLNPNGMIFGEGAALDLNGSFFATTANEIQFGDRTFSANPEGEALALLTVNPSALFFNQIEESSSIILNGAKLEVPAQQDITLLGKQIGERPGISLKNAAISTQGNITLGAVQGDAAIYLDNNLELQFSSATLSGDITLTEASNILSSSLDNSDTHEVKLEVNNLAIEENSSITTLTEGAGNGADININARESVKIIGQDDNFQQFLVGNFTPGGNIDFTDSGLQTISLGAGKAGNIKLTTPNLLLDNGAGIISTTRDRGATGDIIVNVADLTVRGAGLLTGSSTFSLGDVGEIEINTEELLVEQGGVVSSSTLGDGNAGNLSITASDSIQIKQTPENSIIPTGIYTNTIFGNGEAGKLKIDTQKLIVQEGGQLSSSSGAITGNGLIPLGGRGGNITINAAEFIEVSGGSKDGVFSSSILSDTRTSNPGGNLTIDTGSLFLNPHGIISASSLGTGTGGNIVINAKNSVELKGAGSNSTQELFINGLTGRLRLEDVQQGLGAFTVLEGDGGNITINTSRLSLALGTILATGTSGNGDAGSLKITATEGIDLIGSTVAAPTFGDGDAGRIDISTQNLSLIEGGAIASASLGGGDAGDLSISATESVEISNTSANLLFSGSISTGSYKGLSFPGDLTIDTKRLSLKNGANIQANNASISFSNTTEDVFPAPLKNLPHSRGQLTINASESIEISGNSSQIGSFNANPNSHISSTTSTSAPASDVLITTGNLSISDRGEISVDSLGNGAAGSLKIVAGSVSLENEANLNGTTFSGQGGNIVLQVDDILQVIDRSSIDTNAAIGNGGNITIGADFVIVSDNSSISANARNLGNGGNVSVTTNDLFLTPNSQITASSVLGIDGEVTIETFPNAERNSLTKLPEQIIEADNYIVQSCRTNSSQGVFTYTGRGGLPFSPLTEYQSGNMAIADLALPDYSPVERQSETERIEIVTPTQTVVEAQEWKINENGQVELVASTSKGLLASQFNSACSL
ncbi:filamentous hemagglutinin N-terminal domain-containing protein [Pleurocapsales cyanobacterium LEGE 10410]|nr:filamentous hemagglutinin N-terminal domain-containing protein [Pleurocapsales cyanobacterium LEGE 10410]